MPLGDADYWRREFCDLSDARERERMVLRKLIIAAREAMAVGDAKHPKLLAALEDPHVLDIEPVEPEPV